MVLSLVCSGTVQVWWMIEHKVGGSDPHVLVFVLGTVTVTPRAAERRQRRPVLAATGTHISVR